MTDTILRLPGVKARTGLSRSTIYDKIQKKEFPAPVKLGERAVGWLDSEIDAWVHQLVENSRQPVGGRS